MKKRNSNLIHPGEILLEEFLKPMGLSQYKLAKEIHVGAMRINKIIRGERAMTADTAIRLGCYFKMDPWFWMNLQASYDLEIAKKSIGHQLYKKITPHKKAA